MRSSSNREGCLNIIFSFHSMDLEDKFISKVSGIQSLSSSVQSTPEKNGHSDDASRSPELLQEFLKSGPRKDLFRTCFDKEKRHSASSKSKMAEQFAKTTSRKILKNQEAKKLSLSPKLQPVRKQHNRKAENPTRIPAAPDQGADFKILNSLICKNSACRAILSIEDTFCKRCSCCICHLFDDNKDPSLWLECTSESGQGDSCSLSCHIECALQRRKVGVVDLGQLMQLDGSYCCAACGKVSGILGYWKKQLIIAKDARRVDVLWYRIHLCYRLLDGTCRFKDLHGIVKEAMEKLETEVGPVNGVSTQMARGIVSRLAVAGDVQALCSLAIEKADEWLATVSSINPNSREEGSLPAACRFLFEEVTSSSVVIVLIEVSSVLSVDIKGYKLWYCKTREEAQTEAPVCVFPRCQRRVLISNLQPCTEYSFRIVSYTEAGDLGHSEAKCFTKSVEIIHKSSDHKKEKNANIGGSSRKNAISAMDVESDSGFKVRDLGKILRLAWAQERGCFEGICGAQVVKCCEVSIDSLQEAEDEIEGEEEKRLPPPCKLDLNVAASVPDLNEELSPPLVESSSRHDDDDVVLVNGCCTLGGGVQAEDDDNHNNNHNHHHHHHNNNNNNRSHGSGDSQNWTTTHGGGGPTTGEVPAVESRAGKRTAASTNDCVSTLINGDGSRGCLDENFEYCVKIIRWLECEGYIKQEFRLKLLTWFSLRSTEQERRVVNTFIQTLMDDPNSLAGQLVDSFSDIVSSKRPRNGFCSKLWH